MIGRVRLRPLAPRQLRRALDDLADREPNYDVRHAGELTAEHGWFVDEETVALPGEPPGPPTAGGSWEIACELAAKYEFSDPALVRAIFDPARPLAGRDLLLELHFAGLVFYAGCWVEGVLDETRSEADGPVRDWGWYYRTLTGHVEAGERIYEVRKWLETGAVEFRTHSFSRSAQGNPIVRLGFRVFGRRRQRAFTRTACERMAALTRAALMPNGDVSPAASHGKLPLVAETRLLAIYLDDHVAAAVATHQLVKRMLGETRDEEIRSFLLDLEPPSAS